MHDIVFIEPLGQINRNLKKNSPGYNGNKISSTNKMLNLITYKIEYFKMKKLNALS